MGDDDTSRPKRLASVMGDAGRSHANREARIAAAQAQQPRTDPETFEEDSGVYEGEELARIRANRPTPVRFRKLEAHYDSLSKEVVALVTKQNDIALSVSEIKQDVKQVVASNAEVIGSFETFMRMQTAPRSHHDSITRVAKETTTVTLAERVLDEHAKTTGFRRDMWLKIVGGVISAGGLGALIHWLIER